MLLLTTPVAKTIRQDATWWLGSTVWYDRKDARDVASSAQIAQGGIDPPVKKKISHRAAAWPLVGKVSSASLKGLSPGVPKKTKVPTMRPSALGRKGKVAKYTRPVSMPTGRVPQRRILLQRIHDAAPTVPETAPDATPVYHDIVALFGIMTTAAPMDAPPETDGTEAMAEDVAITSSGPCQAPGVTADQEALLLLIKQKLARRGNRTTFGEPTRSKESRAIKAATFAVVRKMEVHSPRASHTQLGSRGRTRVFEQGASHSRDSSPMACDDSTGLEGTAAAAEDSAMLEEDAAPIRMQIRTRASREAARVARLSAALHHQAGQVYRLRDLLEEWQVPPEFYERMSPCWHCELAAACDTQASQLDAVVNAVPLLAPSHLADSVFETTGPDALAFLTRPEWDAFPRPRLAMIGGWGAPGTALLGEDHLALVNSFSELLASEQRINLQMFHRDGCDMPRLPRLPDLLRWPLPGLLDGDDGSLGVKCDTASRVSRAGAVTWWHLDDGGEFVLQVAAPVPESSLQRRPVLLGPSGKPIVKLFIFAPKEFYDLITQDEVQHNSNKFAQLHLFETPTAHLPVQHLDHAVSKDVLPKLWVAPLEAGGRPLLSPANLPHCVITLQDCVMVEMRKIFRLFLDEVDFFMQRAKHWSSPPILYPFISDTLQDAAATAAVAQQLIAVLECPDATASGPDAAPALGPYKRARAACSLKALLSEGLAAVTPDVRAQIEHALVAASDSTPPDPRAEVTLRCGGPATQRVRGVTQFPSPPGIVRCAAHMHMAGRPLWGPVRASIAEAEGDRKALRIAKKGGNLDAQLAALHAANQQGKPRKHDLHDITCK